MKTKLFKSQGFTIIELMVTIVVGAIFVLSIYQLTIVTISITSGSSQYTIASNLAYANLRHYVDGRSAIYWFSCPSSNETAPQTLLSQTGAISGLPSPVAQTVTVTAVYGCSGTNAGTPVNVTSTVTYGPYSQEVSHASYAGF